MSRRIVLIGHPVAHSLSGAMQQAALDALGVDARYELLDKTLLELPGAIAELRGDEYMGANVTIPHKERVAPMMDRLTEDAQATGAVNTITKEGRRLIGHNTDVPAFRKTLDVLVGRQKMPKSAVVLGAGGGARAVVFGLIIEGFQRVIVFNRHLHRAEGMVRHFGRTASHMELRAMPWHESVIEAELAKTKVLINSTAVGLSSDETPIPPELMPPDLLVLDLIYTPAETRLLRDAKAGGASAAMNGELMLLHQGAAALELWTGQPAPVELMRQKLEEARAGGGLVSVDRGASAAQDREAVRESETDREARPREDAPPATAEAPADLGEQPALATAEAPADVDEQPAPATSEARAAVDEQPDTAREPAEPETSGEFETGAADSRNPSPVDEAEADQTVAVSATTDEP
jgi:shikimate dehydrogenase